jgi:hypothetical protein
MLVSILFFAAVSTPSTLPTFLNDYLGSPHRKCFPVLHYKSTGGMHNDSDAESIFVREPVGESRGCCYWNELCCLWLGLHQAESMMQGSARCLGRALCEVDHPTRKPRALSSSCRVALRTWSRSSPRKDQNCALVERFVAQAGQPGVYGRTCA